MYVQPPFEETRVDVLQAFVRAHPLAALVTVSNRDIVIDHMPLLIVPGPPDNGVLQGHLPKANPLWRNFDGASDAVAIFQGPQAYITPSWYPSKQAHGKVVPTWNYVVVHAYGRPRTVDDADWLLRHLSCLTDEHESGRARPWKLSDAPADYTRRLVDRIVGFEMPIDKIAGKCKLSQNRPIDDRVGVAAGLRSQADGAASVMASLVTRYANDDQRDG